MKSQDNEQRGTSGPEVLVQKDERGSGQLVLPGQVLPNKLVVLPVFARPFFPGQLQPLIIPRREWGKTLKQVAETEHKLVGLSYVSAGEEGQKDYHNYARTGCVARIHSAIVQEEHIQFIAQGLQRFHISFWLHKEAPLVAEITYPPVPSGQEDEVRAYAMALIQDIKELVSLNPLYSEELKNFLNHFSPNEPSPLADFAATITTADGAVLQEILETVPLLPRMEKVLELLHKEIEVARLKSEIQQQVKEQVDEQQREYLLKEQLKVIQQELGITKDDRSSDVDDFQARAERLRMSDEAQGRFQEEVKKLSILQTGSPEYAVTRNYLDWLTSMPWQRCTADRLDLERARKILDRDHYGLEDVKQRIIEFLGVGLFRGELKGSILLLVGPPGVGKTSIGQSIAQALGRKFYRFSLGGMRDEAEIKGHRRTYIGAMPGKIAQALKEVEVNNPVIMLDEIDKVGASYQGDPASALLEVLDPEQNHAFLDHYLDLRTDLSNVLFICTANQLDTIPGPLLDRTEVIRLSGYLGEDKQMIAKRYLWPKLLKTAGLKASQMRISQPALRLIAEHYAREAGVRQLNQLLDKIVRKGIVQLLENDKTGVIRINTKNLETYLGKPRFDREQPYRGIGVVTGLAWTAMGGAILPVEARLVHTGKEGLRLTGKLGDVMKESAEIAYSYVESIAPELGIDKAYFTSSLLHLHVPEGATPKDGPSAGITMASALTSLALRQPVKNNLAMTGELTVTGKVLPVGGIREKLVAAKRSGIQHLVLPAGNRKDFDELPDAVTVGLKVDYAATFEDVLTVLFPGPA